MTTDSNPLHRKYHSLTEDQKIAHIKRHTDVAGSCVEMFEMTTGYRLQLIADRFFAVAGQIPALERGLEATRIA